MTAAMVDHDEEARRRAERRAFIRAAHPDTGGDPQRFIDGLAQFDPPAARSGDDGYRLHVYRSRRPDRIVARSLRELRRRASGQPPRRLK